MADPYTNLDNIKKDLPAKIIIQLTDDNRTGDIDELVTDNAIDSADKMIDGYLRGRYPVELDSADIPDLIVDISTKLAIYNLYKRKLLTTLPETISKDYKWCLAMLDKIQTGKISPFPTASEPEIIKTNKTAASKTYSSTVWDTYN